MPSKQSAALRATRSYPAVRRQLSLPAAVHPLAVVPAADVNTCVLLGCFFLPGRPDASRSWNFINSFREDHPEWMSLPGLFLTAPPHTGRATLSLGAGKAYHPMVPPDYDGSRSWSEMALPFDNPCLNTAATANASCRPRMTLTPPAEADGDSTDTHTNVYYPLAVSLVLY